MRKMRFVPLLRILESAQEPLGLVRRRAAGFQFVDDFELARYVLAAFEDVALRHLELGLTHCRTIPAFPRTSHPIRARRR